MTYKQVVSAVVISLLTLSAYAQNSVTEIPAAEKVEEKKEVAELRKEIALLLLKETASEIEMLQSLTNRISFSADIAETAYSLDPAMSRRMYLELADSLSRFIAVQSGMVSDKDRNATGIASYRNAGRTVWKLRRAVAIRTQAVLSAAKHDPVLALDLFDATKISRDVSEVLGYFGPSEDALLMQLASAVSVDDPETVAEFGERLLKNGLNLGAPVLLSKLKGKDYDAALAYAPKVISTASREVDSIDPDLGALAMLLRVAFKRAEKESAPVRPLFDPAEIRNLAEAFGRLILGKEAEEFGGAGKAMEYASVVRPFAPDIADRIQRKFSEENGSGLGTGSGSGPAIRAIGAAPPPPPPPPAASTSSVYAKGAESEAAKEQERIAELEEKMRSPEDDPEKKAAVREYVSFSLQKISEIDDPLTKIAAYVAVTNRLEQLGQKEAASEVLNEAFRSVTANPRNYQDFLQTWTLAGALVERQPERAFAIIEDLVFRLNGVVANFHGFAEFLDSNGEILDEGELQFGGFGGGMMNQMMRTLDSNGLIVRKLADTDLARTRALTERFDRPEIRVTARLLILKSFVSEEEPEEEDPDVVPVSSPEEDN
ncbi:MAG TPA: hypothetical protein VMM38_00715 [Aridibacter sp.]|nr:hypothetical protein [Aridibacter sp.]